MVEPFAQIVDDQGPAAAPVSGQDLLQGNPNPLANLQVTPPSPLPPPHWGPIDTPMGSSPPRVNVAGNQPPPAIQAPAAQQVGEPSQATSEPQELALPKDDPNQFQYWQSQADKFKKDAEQLRQERTELGQVDAISRHILSQSPEAQMAILQGVQQSFSGGQPQSAQAVQESLKRPDRPKKPSDYSAVDAASDPESSSATYREAMDQYRDDLDEWRDQKTEMEAQERSRQIAVQQQTMARAHADQQLDERGYDPAKRAQFWNFLQFLTTRASLNDFIPLFENYQAPNQQQNAEVQRKIEEMQRERQRQGLTMPLGTEGGEQPAPPDVRPEGDILMDTMIAEKAKANPFQYHLRQDMQPRGQRSQQPQPFKPPAW